MSTPRLHSLPRVSIVIPYFRAGRYAAQLAACIAAQSHRDYEVIVVDDGRGAEFEELYRAFVGHHLVEKTVFLSTWRGRLGPSRARNIAIAVASADYIAFLDADDTWDPPYLEEMLSIACESGARIIACEVRYHSLEVVTRLVLGKFLTRQKLLQTNLLHVPSVLVRRAEDWPRFPIDGHEDYALWLTSVDVSARIPCLNRPLVHVNRVPGSVSSNKSRAAIWHWRVLKAHSGKTLPTRVLLFTLYIINALSKRRGAEFRPLLLPDRLIELLP